MRILTYTLARLGIFALSLGVLYLLQTRGWLLVLVALVVTALVSYIALPKLRDSAAGQVRDLSLRQKKPTEEEREDELIESRIAEHRDEIQPDGALPNRADEEPREREQ